jgi:hypothetical protein
MDKDNRSEMPTPTTKQWKLPLIYKKELIDSFWNKTDEKTRKLDSPECSFFILTILSK